jgi:mannosyl-3-phosphoglycerate phosphatase
LIITTSKTRREVELIRKEIGIVDPFITENGGGIYVPQSYQKFHIEYDRQVSSFKLIQLGISYGRIRAFMMNIHNRFKVRGFGDLSVHEVSSLTGLSVERAKLAKLREFTEPFIIESDHDLTALRSLATDRGIKVTQGGRFYHMIGMFQDKGEAVKIVRDFFDRNIGEEHLTIGIGDSANDLPMLHHVDIPVLIPHPLKGYLDASLFRLLKAKSPGCRGWNDIVKRILNGLKKENTRSFY